MAMTKISASVVWVMTLAVLSALAVTALLHARQPSAGSAGPRVALVGAWPQERDPTLTRFRDALSRGSQAAGSPVRLEYHAGGDTPPTVRLAIEAACAARPAVLVLPTADSAAIGAMINPRPPIVFASFFDPVATGLVDSLQAPGRHTTGVSLADDLDMKRLEVLKDAFPHVRRIAVLADRSWLASLPAAALTQAAQRLLAVELVFHTADTAEQLDVLMHDAPAAQADAWYIAPTYIAYVAEAAIIGHLQRLRRPGIHATAGEVANGAVMAYAQDNSFAIEALATLALRVAAGEDAGTIAIERPRRYELSVRVADVPEWARVAPSVVRRADRLY